MFENNCSNLLSMYFRDYHGIIMKSSETILRSII